jgi:hypothetical protein
MYIYIQYVQRVLRVVGAYTAGLAPLSAKSKDRLKRVTDPN